jgi:transposase
VRTPSKYVKQITKEEELQLIEIVKISKNHKQRMRAEIIILSNKQYSIDEIEKIKDLDRDRISALIDKWEIEKIGALKDKPRTGRPKKLNVAEEIELKKLIDKEPKNLKKVIAEIEQQFDKEISVSTVKRVLKKTNIVGKE